MNYPLLVCLIGFIVYEIGTEWWKRPQIAEVGRLMFFAGLLVWLFVNQSKTVF